MCNFPEPPSPQPLSQKGRGAKIWIGSPSPLGRRGRRADFKLHIALIILGNPIALYLPQVPNLNCILVPPELGVRGRFGQQFMPTIQISLKASSRESDRFPAVTLAGYSAVRGARL